MTPQEAVEAPRIWTLGEELEVEPGFSDAVLTELGRRGHQTAAQPIVGAGMGMIAQDGARLTGASCWRADGTPIGIGGGMARAGIRFSV